MAESLLLVKVREVLLDSGESLLLGEGSAKVRRRRSLLLSEDEEVLLLDGGESLCSVEGEEVLCSMAAVTIAR